MIVKSLIPNRNPKYLDAICSCPEVSLSVDSLTILDRPKENDSSQSIASYKEKHAHDDEKTLVHADKHCLHQHLQCGMLASDGEKP